MILGHAALAALARHAPAPLAPLPALLLASYGPDLLDKTCMILLGTPSKWLGHTLAACLAVWLACLVLGRLARRPGLALLMAVLWTSHVVCDLTGPDVLVWPVGGPIPDKPPYDLAEGFLAFYTGQGDLDVLFLDLACLAVWLIFCPGLAVLRRLRKPPASKGLLTSRH